MRWGSTIKLAGLLVLVAVIAVLAVKPVFPEGKVPWLPLTRDIDLGLDLQGGVHVVLEAKDTEDIKVDDQKMDQLLATIERRVNGFGVSEPVVQREGERRIVVELAGIDDPEAAVDSIVKTAYLEFIAPDGKVILTGADLENAVESIRQDTNQAIVNLEFTPEGTKKFAEATKKYLHQNIAIVLDGQLLQNPYVKDPILDGKAFIDGYASFEEAHEIGVLLRSGALPVKVEVMEKRTVGPTLGKDSLDRSIKAGIIGLALILAFMVTYYRVPGLVANIALLIYSIIVLGLFVVFDVVLTLPGIAGFILSLGIAVDANIIIFERIKEELKNGKSLRSAIDAGFKRAFVAVLDSNVTTLIAAVVLYYFGASMVRGFALTLSIGILSSMFTAITLTRWMLKLTADTRIIKNTKFYGA
ncbi:preprotein translocase subunit SecD [Desulfohalotomaculum tongense]|uniref:protein translocase subunit SecD n=1 Tax=Desulforadius tongensis TaxID=1216062 RepID=UPI00195EEAD9|nr:protein translocase subunit SecD [Desulforadius tongensis]MBM7855124.1 preprotein translocase subunit SecD [Desulforadius tongensis]